MEKENKEVQIPWYRTLFEYCELFALTLALVVILNCFVFNHVVVEGSSMNQTYYDGEHLVVSNLFYTPKQGDIVVFEKENGSNTEKSLIKRVIATENQTVCIYPTYVTVDGIRLTEDYAYLLSSSLDYVTYIQLYGPSDRLELKSNLSGVFYYECKVGEDELFVMGDNRYNSNDSRFFGPISCDCVFGHVLFRLGGGGK